MVRIGTKGDTVKRENQKEIKGKSNIVNRLKEISEKLIITICIPYVDLSLGKIISI